MHLRALLVAIVLAFALASSATHEARAANCFGTSGADTITCTNAADYIITYEEPDTVYARDGADYVESRQGQDTVYGGNGNDLVWGGDSGDNLYAGCGTGCTIGSGIGDQLLGELGSDGIRMKNLRYDEGDGGAGTDTCWMDAFDGAISCETEL